MPLPQRPLVPLPQPSLVPLPQPSLVPSPQRSLLPLLRRPLMSLPDRSPVSPICRSRRVAPRGLRVSLSLRMSRGSRPPASWRARQTGQALIEFAIVAIPILLAGAAIIEVARWQAARMMAGMALLEAARAASTKHGNPDALQSAFEHALRPWFAASGSHRDSAHRQRTRFAAIEAQLAQAPYRVQIDAPNDGHFARFADPALNLPIAGSRKIINADYLAEQHARSKSRRAASGDTIFDATTLKLRLTYLHTPIVPGVRALVQMLGASSDAYGTQAIAQGFIPIRRDIALEMHSHPVQWTTVNHAMARVVHTRASSSQMLPPTSATPPTWQWGTPSITHPGAGPTPPADHGSEGPDAWRPITEPDVPTTDPPSGAGDDPSGAGTEGDSPSDPACGTVICCDR